MVPEADNRLAGRRARPALRRARGALLQRRAVELRAPRRRDTRRRILPRPAVSGAQSTVMFTPASASVRASFARTPGFDSRLRTSCVVLGMTFLLLWPTPREPRQSNSFRL